MEKLLKIPIGHPEDSEERLKHSLLRVLLERFPNLKEIKLFERGIICPQVAANAIFDKICPDSPGK
jgi:hypothetical protein